MKSLHEATGILLKYVVKDVGDFYVSAEHDEIFLGGPPPEKMKSQDVDRLEVLGVTYDENLPAWHMFV